MAEESKISYRTMAGYVSKAYVDIKTGIGTDKHSDVPVRVVWSDKHDTWVEIDLFTLLPWQQAWFDEVLRSIAAGTPYPQMTLPSRAIAQQGKRYWEEHIKEWESAWALHYSDWEPEPFVRVQPKKKLSRKKRNHHA